MEEAIRNNDWYEVGEILNKCIQTHDYAVDLAQLSIHMYKIDPEVLTTYFISAPLSPEKRSELHQQIQKSVKSNPVSCDILRVSELYHSDDEKELQKLTQIVKTITSTTARFYAYCGLVKLNMKLMKAGEVHKYFKLALALLKGKDFLKHELQKYIDAAFCISIVCPTADMFCFQFCADLLSPEARNVYTLITEGCSQKADHELKATDCWGHEVVATVEEIRYH